MSSEFFNATVIDFETTGLSVKNGDRIIEIGAIKLAGNRITGIFEAFINPGREIPPIVTQITGIVDDMVKDAPDDRAILPELIKFIGSDTVVMHNVEYDSAFLITQTLNLGVEVKYQYYCTLKTARQKFKTSPNFKLATLKNHLRLEPFGTMHRALSDAFVTAQLFLKLEGMYAMDSKTQLQRDMEQLMSIKNPGAVMMIRPV